ncbi:MAG: type II secretion system protein [Candidatus Wallbacteria bacterium]|nr:type II secretion system protein [Candidatus Wallbacteria bacterium]
MLQRSKQRGSRRGFSYAEIMVSISIFGLLFAAFFRLSMDSERRSRQALQSSRIIFECCNLMERYASQQDLPAINDFIPVTDFNDRISLGDAWPEHARLEIRTVREDRFCHIFLRSAGSSAVSFAYTVEEK